MTNHYGDEIEFGKLVAETEEARLLEISGYGSQEYESSIEEIQTYFPDFVIEEGKRYLVDY